MSGEHSAPDHDAEIMLGVCSYGRKSNGNIPPYDAKINVGCLLLRSEMNGGNIQAPYDAKNKCWVLCL